MILIAHRGLYEGWNEELENRPEQLLAALAEGFDAETDVRYIDGKWWLGHDEPTYEVDEDFILTNGLWLHAKNLAALTRLCARGANYFWHQGDDYTITSKGWIWAYPGQPLSEHSIRNQPEWKKGWFDRSVRVQDEDYAGVCSKFVKLIRDAR